MPDMTKVMKQDSSFDPLDRVLAPPVDETAEERDIRISKEKEAKILSDAIDKEIEDVRIAERRKPKPVKILLLGQSESGKSTTLKNFQLMYDPKVFRSERASWRAVIQLNVVRSFHLIMDALTRVQKASQSSSSSSIDDIPIIPPELLKLKLRLAPLLAIEDTLIRRLTPAGSEETEATHRGFGSGSTSSYSERAKQHVGKEVAINSTKSWKESFTRFVQVKRFEGGEHATNSGNSSEDGIDWDDPEDPGRVLFQLSEDMARLWTDPVTQRLLDQQNIRMRELAGFFLDQLERVTAPRYIPTDDDILKARLKTLGVTEHRFIMAGTKSLGRDWRIFDVGGHRSQRAAWVPYFDDMNSIIFLAPISCFDQTLVEDPKVNRLADSVTLWTSIVKNPIFKSTNLILFLNKVDIFRAKLDSGIRLADYIVSYGDRPNDFETTTSYIRKKFADILKDKSPLPRVFYCHLTTVTDTKSTSYILASLREMILRANLAKTDLAV